MATRRVNDPKRRTTRMPPATTPEERENQLINLSYNVAEEQLLSGQVSAQVLSYYLKLGSSREKLEQERLAMEVELLAAKREQLESQARFEVLVEDALNAMRSYSGQGEIHNAHDDDVFDD